MDQLSALVGCVRALGGEELILAEDGQVDFSVGEGGIPGFAYVKDGGRLRGSVWIASAQDGKGRTFDEAAAWKGAQPPTLSGELEILQTASVSGAAGDYAIRLLFERPLDPSRIDPDDPLMVECLELFIAWADDERDAVARFTPGAVLAPDDPTHLVPTNAWLLVADQTSAITKEEVFHARERAAKGIYENAWTAAKQTEPGDLLFWYQLAPTKAVTHVARAVDAAHFIDMDEPETRWRGRQWWCHYSPPVEIQPIGLPALQGVMGPTVMRGRSGRYLRPEHVADLTSLVRPLSDSDGPQLKAILQPVQGLADLPDPQTCDLAQWREVAAGAMRLESDVERHLVEPLIRWVGQGRPGLVVSKSHRTGRRIADYAVLKGERPVFVVEVKLRIRRAPGRAWTECKDFRQAADYAERLGCPAILIDAHEIHAIPVGATSPSRSWRRGEVQEEQIDELRRELGA